MTVTLFEGRERRRLVGIAYRMLGSAAEAEDVVQEAYLRLHEQPTDGIENARAWLTAVVARVAIDRLRRLQVERTHYPGEWLPEPWLDDPADDGAEDAAFLGTDLSYGLLLLLERLNPTERVAFVLHEALDYEHRDIAPILEKSEANVRQIVHRARTRLRREDARPLAPELRASLLQQLTSAVLARDSATLAGLLAEQAEFHGDGGGKVSATRKPLFGGDLVARFLLGTAGAAAEFLTTRTLTVNGAPGIAWILQGKLAAVMQVEADPRDPQRVGRIFNVANPDKLAIAARQLGLALAYAES